MKPENRKPADLFCTVVLFLILLATAMSMAYKAELLEIRLGTERRVAAHEAREAEAECKAQIDSVQGWTIIDRAGE